MQSIPKNDLLRVTQDQFLMVRKAYGATAESLNTDVDILITWFKQQPHLPKVDLDREWIERMYIINKCSIERTKHRIDMIYASRNLMPEFFRNRNPTTIFKISKKASICMPLPKLSNDNTRVFLIQTLNLNSEAYELVDLCRLFFLMTEYRQYHDYMVGDRYVIDVKNLTIGHILKNYPTVLKNAETALKEVLGIRIAGMHLINGGSMLAKLIMLFKTVLSPKLSGRILVHKNMESLYEVIPRDIFPKEYGGDEKPFNELFDDWETTLCNEKQTQWFQDQENIRSDESCRPPKTINDDMLGVAGSFKKLNVD